MRRLLSYVPLVTVMAFMLHLGGCGYKGPLSLPETPTAPQSVTTN